MRRARSLIVLSLIFVLAASAARTEAAGEARGRTDRVTEGTLFWRSAEQETLVPAPTLKTDVAIIVTGVVARATVRQEFTNPSRAWAEGILELALAHHLVSPYTSLVAIDVTPVRPGDEALTSHALKTNLPHGWDYTAVFGLGQGATDAPVRLAVGVVTILCAAALAAVALRTRKV